jgi:hypothetical protein
MLWDCCQVLVEQKLQTVMVHLHHECPAPQIGAPMADDLHQAVELSFIGRQFGVSRGNLASEEGEWPVTLMKYYTDAGAGGVALDHERTVKIQ